MNKLSKRTSMEDDEEGYPERASDFLPYMVKQHICNEITIPLDEYFVEPAYYRNICAAIEQATKDDEIVFKINSYGGRLDGLYAILDAIEQTEATTIARIIGPCYSSASILALSCDLVELGNHAEMLCHAASHGSGGKSPDVEAAVMFISRQNRKVLTQAYKDFLSQDEINQVIQGRELYLDVDEIAERLEKRQEIHQKQFEDKLAEESKFNQTSSTTRLETKPKKQK